MTHPVDIPSVNTKTLKRITRDWHRRAHVATQQQNTLIADIWLSAADEIEAEMKAARERWQAARAARKKPAAQAVEDRAIARQLKDQTLALYVQSAGYFDQAYQQEPFNALAAQESRRAGEIAHERAVRSEKALDILLEHTGLDPSEIDWEKT